MTTLWQPVVLNLLLFFVLASQVSAEVSISVDLAQPGKAISPDLFGIFYEDLNYAADGGLYAELVRNRSFEFSPADKDDWHSLTAWELLELDGGDGHLTTDNSQPLHPNNPRYAIVGVIKPEGRVGLRNDGFEGFPVAKGQQFDFSFFARQLSGYAGQVLVSLETKSGDTLGELTLPAPDSGWKKYSGQLTVSENDTDARLVIYFQNVGRTAIDMVSLFPQDTFHGRKNGLRKDLAQAVADLAPKFVRFPGGCLVHGDGLDNMYRWKDTIGPVEMRKAQRNIWRYHQTLGLGYYEYFQFCEDIGAKPLPVVPAAVCCQNAGARVTRAWGRGQRGLPLREMPAYVQEVLDLIEWANGPADSPWGSKRAAAGHPEPFGLEYLGIGNEDHITSEFEERFEILFNAVKARHPEITVIGTSGPHPDGPDFDRGWNHIRALGVPMVDEHYYKSPDWFLQNLQRYDSYDRSSAKVYVGEYAAHDRGKRNTWRSALAEAAYLTGLERNGDIVHFASYAPLLCKVTRRNWSPDLIYFSNTYIDLTLNYHVQKLFSLGAGETWLSHQLTGLPTQGEQPQLCVSTVRQPNSSSVVLKLVNLDTQPLDLAIQLNGTPGIAGVERTTLQGELDATHAEPNKYQLDTDRPAVAAGQPLRLQVPPHSLTVLHVALQE